MAQTPEIEGVKIDIIQAGEIVHYTIPSFPVSTVDLRPSVWDDREEEVKIFDAFLRECPDIVVNVLSSAEVTESCNISVSHQARSSVFITMIFFICKYPLSVLGTTDI